MGKDYSIKTDKEKADRKTEVNAFADKYGNGSVGLTEDQKKERIKKILGSEENKVKDFGTNLSHGVELKKENMRIDSIPEDNVGVVDLIPKETISSLSDFPLYRNAPNDEWRITNIEVDSDGTTRISGIAVNGNEANPATRQIWSVESISDEESARSEMNQHSKGILRAVSDRTMAIHEENGDLDSLFEDPDIDTDEDKPMQY